MSNWCFNLSAQNILDTMNMRQGPWLYEGPFDSTLMIYPIIKCNYINDTLDGLYEKIDENNIVRLRMYLRKGLREGGSEMFDKKGNVSIYHKYSNDTLKLVIIFDKKQRIYKYYETNNNHLDGLNLLFHNNGKVFIKCNYLNGKLNGDYFTYKKSGKLKYHFYYINDYFSKVP
jgi:antitoxin component YwqK of YwqJK toxin-antitoxin module